jgi:protein SCO1/2
MRIVKSQPQHSSWLTYVTLAVLLIGLFLAGLKLGSVVFASPGQSGSTAAGGQPSDGAILNSPFQVHDFALTNQAGEPMNLKDLRGRAIVLYFGYTHCPDVCPATLADFTLVKKALGKQADQVSFVFVTVDSQRDTPEVLAEYGAYFSLPADQQMDDGHNNHNHHEEGIDSDNYFVQHTSPAYLIDPKGFLRVVYFNGTSPEVIATGVRRILQEAD